MNSVNAKELTPEPLLGLNMHPKWLEGGPPEDFLLPLREAGLTVLEFPMRLLASDWDEMDALVSACRRLEFDVSFHAPYGGSYNVARFLGAEQESAKRLFDPVIGYAAAIASEDGPTTLVVHGAEGHSGREELKAATVSFIDWLWERAPQLEPALELRARESDAVKIGDRKVDLLEIIARSGNPQLGICWDLGHDAVNGWSECPPGFVERVSHVHVHDLSPSGEDHFPLLFGNVPYGDALDKLRRSGYQGVFILEVNGYSVVRIARERSVSYTQLLQESLGRVVEALSPPL